MELKKEQMYFLTIVGILVFSLMIIKPLITPILFAAILAYLFSPIHTRLKNKLSPAISAGIITIIIIGLFIIIINSGIRLIINEFTNIYLIINSLSKIPALGSATQNISELFLTKIISYSSTQILQLPAFLISIIIFFASLFFFLRDGEKLWQWFKKIAPFPDKKKKIIFHHIKEHVNAFVHVQIVIGILQGIIAVIGFKIFGLPYPIIAGFIAGILSIIPILGPYLLYLPAGGIIIYQGNITTGIFLISFGLIVGSIFDYLARPYFIGKRAKTHPLIMYVGIFGGIMLMGIIGIIIGPVILSIAEVVFRESIDLQYHWKK